MTQKIIVIDDEPLILMTLEKALARVGYDVTATSSPEEFIKSVESKSVDLLIVDLHIKGCDTEALITKARELSPDVKLLIVSGSILDIPPGNYLQKPFQISELRVKVQELLDGP